MARARRLAAAGAVTAFVVGGVSMMVGIGAATAESAQQVPTVASTCLIPLLPCESSSGGGSEDPWSPQPNPQDSWSSAPAPDDSWSSGPAQTPAAEEPEPEHPWQPVDEEERKWPDGAPQTGGGALSDDGAMWPFAVGGCALLAGGGLAGFALRRRKGDA